METPHQQTQSLIRRAMQLAGIPGNEQGEFQNSHFKALNLKICQDVPLNWQLDPRTYRRFWNGERFERTDARKVLSAYILIKEGRLDYKDIPLRKQKNETYSIPSIDYWQLLQANPETPSPATETETAGTILHSKRYKTLFFSHVRYDVWDEGYLELHYTQSRAGQVVGGGFYRNNSDTLTGTFEIAGNHLCMDLQRHKAEKSPNWLKVLAKIDGARMHEAPYFRAACITVSSYSQQYISAVEMVFLDETYACEPAQLLKVKRYLMLQRHRFRSEVLSPADPLLLSPSGFEPGDLRILTGNYLCISRINQHLLVSVLSIDNLYRSEFRTKIFGEASDDKNYQLCYLEVARGNTNYVSIRGYKAQQNTDEPNLGSFVSTITLPLGAIGNGTACGTFSSLVEIDGREFLWAGEVWLFRQTKAPLPDPLLCPLDQLPALLSAGSQPLADCLRSWQQHTAAGG